MKKIFLIILIVFGCNFTVILHLFFQEMKPEEVFHINVCLPLQTAKGQMMLNGIKLYLSDLKRENPAWQKRIRLKIYDDKDDAETAAALADKIGMEDKAMAVIGHNDNAAAHNAGKIYKRFGMIAVTGSATSTDVTKNNEWYFSAVPGDTYQAAVMAAFIQSKNLKINIIQDQSIDSINFGREFRKTAADMDIPIKKEWRIKADGKLDRIVHEINTRESIPDFILLNTDNKNSIRILNALKNRQTLNIIATSRLMDHNCIRHLKELARKNHLCPSHYLNGLYTLSPFLINLSDEQAYEFRKRYHRQFKHEPFWEAACYYDVMKLLSRAMEATPFNASDTMLQKRKQLQKTLAGYNSPVNSVNGITANLYFNRDGCIERPYTIGQYVKEGFSPVNLQYYKHDAMDKDNLEKVLTGKAIWVNKELMGKKHIVYCGIKMNSLKEVELKKGFFSADFYLWLRFIENFHEKDLVFPRAISPISLKEPVWEQLTDGVTTQVFRIQAKFKNRFDFFRFPFEHHSLNISFHNASIRLKELVYMEDFRLPPDLPGGTATEDEIFADPIWRIETIQASHDIISHTSTLGLPDNITTPSTISYSRFNTHINITRKNPFSALLHVLPLFLGIIVLGGVDYGIINNPAKPLVLLTVVLTTTLMNHLWLANIMWVNYLLLMDHLFFAVYTLVFVSGLVQLMKYRLWQADYRDRAMLLSRGFKTAYLIGITVGFTWIGYYILT